MEDLDNQSDIYMICLYEYHSKTVFDSIASNDLKNRLVFPKLPRIGQIFDLRTVPAHILDAFRLVFRGNAELGLSQESLYELVYSKYQAC